ncbi:ribosomal protein S18-alanine N-acetyltransferase [Chitinispirillales bacterium ANBcel5]|uniref:ribosomal protein S18-alanine N-acetyltransferase n=1 Tax=Cellulosispirillum alkaliphilum TaxID=3039283 RepID=UPI002A55040C|nr:ribosomal protein S18-alanine N-acetyltransferase [Chitinispirillales bacterium ANBcel5]
MNNSHYFFREARGEDIDSIARLESLCHKTPRLKEQLLCDFSSPYSLFTVIGTGERIIAYTCTTLLMDELEIHSLGVSPIFRSRGIGLKLLCKTIDLAVKRGMHKAWLEVRVSNLAARRLYKRCGFREKGRRKRYYRDGEDALVLAKII